jgi:hypothetical protein
MSQTVMDARSMNMKHRINPSILALCVCVISVSRSNVLAQPLLKIDFGFSDSALVQPGFTAVTGEISQPTHTETIGPYTISLNGESLSGGGFYSTSGAAGNIASGVRNLFRDYYYNNSPFNGEGVLLSLTGFVPDHTYDVTVWSYDADNIGPFGTPTPTVWSPLGNTSGTPGTITNFATPYPTSLSDFSTTLQLSSTTDTLELFGTTTSGGGGTRLNGVTIKDGATTLLALDFGRPPQASSPTQATYTALTGDASQSTFSQAVGSFNISLEGQGFFNTTSSNAGLIDASVRDFYRDYYYNNATPGQGVKLVIDGVTPNTDYDLTLWTYDADNFSATPTNWTPAGTTTGPVGSITNIQSPYPTSLADYRTTIRVRSTTTSLEVRGASTAGTGGTRLNGFELNLAPEGVDGDYNENGVVDAGDYIIWRKNVGTTITLPNDPTGGTIGPQQYNTWRANFGRTPGSGTIIGGAAVPEPSSLLVLLTIMLIQWRAFCGRR